MTGADLIPNGIPGGRTMHKVADRLQRETGRVVEAVPGGYIVWSDGPWPCFDADTVRKVAGRINAHAALQRSIDEIAVAFTAFEEEGGGWVLEVNR